MALLQQATGKRAKVTALASTISAILGSAGAFPTIAQGQQAQQGQQELEEVLVTGSRIVRRDLSAPSPIMTVEAERFENTSTLSVESVLNQMPQFIPDQTQFNAQGAIQTTPTASLGIGTANLRGVQSNRTLVLLDGRRAQPTNAALIVDLNSIPSAAIERVETITGGASAVYGADALAGVVNFVLKDDFEGVSLDMQTGFTDAGDGEETRFSALLGMNSGTGNANMLLGVEWYERDMAMQKNRDFFVDGWFDPSNQISTFFPSMPAFVPGGNAPDQAVVDSLFPQFAPGTIPNTSTFYFNADGTPFIRTPTGSPGFDDSQLNQPYSGDGFYGLIRQANGSLAQQYMEGALSTPLERRSAFGKAYVDFSDNMRAFVQANFSRYVVETQSAGPPPAVGGSWGSSIPNDGRSSIPSALQTLLDSRAVQDDPLTTNVNEGAWSLYRGLDFLGQFGPTNSTDVYQIMAGLEGQFERRDWTWEAYFSSGETNVQNFYRGMPSVQAWKFMTALPEFAAGANATNGVGFGYQLTCDSGLPVFSGTLASTSPNCIQSVLGSYKTFTVIKQDIFEANLQGGIVDMPAGQLRFAAGVSTRDNAYDYQPLNPQASIFDTPMGVFPSAPAYGETSVNEIYGELLVPLAERFDIELGYRQSDYDSAAGTVGTYKALFDWGATDFMRLRGGVQSANRAPNSAELFQSQVVVFSTGFVGDPCQTNTLAPWGNVPGNPNRANIQQLCAELIDDPAIFGAPGSASADNFLLGTPGAPFTGINGLQGGNPNLESEEADTWTLGVVFQAPGGLDGLTASIDFYNIEIQGAIDTFSGNTIYEQCFNVNGISNPAYSANDPAGFCSLIQRSETDGGAGVVSLTYLNTGFIETSGVDLSVNWAKDLSTGGTFFVNTNMNILNEFNTQEKPGDPVDEWKNTLGQGGQYDYRLNTTFGFNFSGGKANIGLRWRHLPEIRSANAVNDTVTNIFPTDSYNNFDLFAGYTFNDRYQLRGGIDNLLDEDPAIVGATPTDSNSNSTLAGYYDTLGRRAYVGLKILF